MVRDADALLLARFADDKADAFATLFARYYNQVYRVLYGLVGSREEAEDLAQETFLTLYRQPPRLAADMPLLAWLCRVAINRGRNALRGARRTRARLERIGRLDMPPVIDLDTALIRAEEQARVRAAMATLPERQARLLLLRHAGLAYAEVAAVLGIAPGSVGTLLARAEKAFVAAYERLREPADADLP